jgi:formate-dependent nitrite reductase membrane component NrfD
MNGYYGYPMIKPPEWTDLIPTYFFTGGMAGMCATVAFAERIAKNDPLARPMIFGAAAGAAVSGFCLIADLKRPERFANMLRVFKPTSPMSVGVYIFSAFSGATFVAAASEFTGVLRPVGRMFEGIAALIGPAMSCYTAVLIGDTVVPAWHYGRRTMPALFAATSASTAAGWGLLFAPTPSAGTARRLAMIGGPAVLAALQMLHEELGLRQKHAYETGEAAMFSKVAKVLNITGTIAAVAAKNYSPLSKLAGALLLAGGLAERFGVFRAGCNSAREPSYTIEAQRSERGQIEARTGAPVTT